MNRIECSKCGILIETTAASVVLPFVCMACGFTESEVDQFYEDMAPASSLPCTASWADPEVVKQVEPELSDEFATVENTTALMQDLETQIVNLNQQVADLQRWNDNQTKTILDLQSDNERAVWQDLAERRLEEITHLQRKGEDRQQEMSLLIDRLDAELNRTKKEADRQRTRAFAATQVPWYRRFWEQICDRLPEAGGL